MAHRLFERAQTRRAARNVARPQHAVGPAPTEITGKPGFPAKPPDGGLTPIDDPGPFLPGPLRPRVPTRGGTVEGVISPTFQEDQARIRDRRTRRPTIRSAVPATPAVPTIAAAVPTTPAVPTVASAARAVRATPAGPARSPDLEGTGIEGDFTRGFNPDTENRLFRRSLRGSKTFTKAELKRGYRKLK